MNPRLLILTSAGPLLILSACHREQAPVQAQRISLDNVSNGEEEPLPSPDTKGAAWTVSGSGQAIDFGQPGEKPFLTLACNVKADPAQVTIVRHAPSRPGEKALFPVISNSINSRFKVDAVLRDHEWRWEGTLPADDGQLDVFEGGQSFEATLPGGGSLKVAASRMPSQFLDWCRKRGQGPALAAPQNDKAAKPAA
jgi:hypothetical protein